MKDYDYMDYKNEDNHLTSKNKSDENFFEPYDEKELDDGSFQQFEVKNESEDDEQRLEINFIPRDEKDVNHRFRKYSAKDVKYWIQLYKKYKSFSKVRNHLDSEGKELPAISTLKIRIKELIGNKRYKELMKKYTFDDAIKFVSQVSIDRTGIPGKILSNRNEFKGVKSMLLCQYGKCNYKWQTTLDAIINGKHWCLKCVAKKRVENQRGSVIEHQNIINQKGGKLKGVIYEDPNKKLFNQRTRFIIECEAGHKFNIKANNLKQGKWCRKCSTDVVSEKLRGSFQDIQKLIEKRGDICLSNPKDYKNQHQKLKIQCDKEHIFERRPSNLKRGDWGPVCSQGRFEIICRSFFEEIFQNKFPKGRPNWLVNSRGNQMELDGYNESLGVAFEAQGEQHYHLVPRFHNNLKDFEQRIEDDLKKIELCRYNNVILIQIPYYLHFSKIQSYITDKYESLSNKKLPIIPKIDYNDFYYHQDKQKKMDKYL
ncbi:MAG: hypothetical protein ACFFD7_16745 [Candidatus Thorarchaeota archaeon]